MNRLLHLQDKIRTNTAALARLEAELSRFPNSGGLLSNILTLRKQQQNLQRAFSHAADELGFDVVHYKILEDSPTIKAFTRAIAGFQDALAITYEALRFGPKSRRIVSPEVATETALRFAYSYPGSTALAFTVPNARLLSPDWKTRLDRATETVVDIGKAANNTGIISKFVKELGRAPIVAIYEWAKDNTQNHTGAEIEWYRDESLRKEALIQVPEFGALSYMLERAGEKKEVTERPTGVLVGADIRSHRFHFVTDDDIDIRGKFTDAISESQQAQLPAKYRAILQKTVEITYATEEEKPSYFLERLESPA